MASLLYIKSFQVFLMNRKSFIMLFLQNDTLLIVDLKNKNHCNLSEMVTLKQNLIFDNFVFGAEGTYAVKLTIKSRTHKLSMTKMFIVLNLK